MKLNEIHSVNKVFGGLVDNLHGGFGLVDNISMTYEGNMLTSVFMSNKLLFFLDFSSFYLLPYEYLFSKEVH